MAVDLLILVACAAATVGAVRVLVITGIEILCTRFGFSPKTKGQVIGYATSVPEFAVVISAALVGVFDAGLWNIASSNIINTVLFAGAVLVYRQQPDLKKPRFADELAFGALSVALPIALVIAGVTLGIGVSCGLLGLFVVYKIVDRAANPKAAAPADPGAPRGSLWKGIGALVLGIAIVTVAGRFLGTSAERLIGTVGVPAWLVGWILGFITSVPEMTSFFEIYRLHRKRDQLHLAHDTQEALDALVASNMCNLGVILPLGMIVFAIVTA